MPTRGQAGSTSVASASSSDETAFAGLVAAHQSEILRICYLILGDRALAEDAAQSTWITAWRKLHQVRDERKVRSWLLAVAANEARQTARRRRVAWLPIRDTHVVPAPDPALADLAAALKKLTVDQRRLIALRYVGQLTSEETGSALGISANAARHRLMRVLERLRSELR